MLRTLARALCLEPKIGGSPLALNERSAAARAVSHIHDDSTRSRFARAGATALCILALAPAHAVDPVRSVRVWPSADYTRITVESAAPLRYELTAVKDPERVVLDLNDVTLASVQQAIAGKVRSEDPHVAQFRAGQFRPGVVRLVVDLKAEMKPQVFAVPPVGEYGHRLVLDLYPVVPADSLMALVEQQQSRDGGARETPLGETPGGPVAPPVPGPFIEPRSKPGDVLRAPRGQPAAPRTVTVMIDAGHGGEDPGARGRRGTHEKNVTLSIARRLKALIDAEPNMRAVMTRNGDYFVPLAVRVDKARRAKADLFVSIHADAFMLPHARGSSVFALSERGATSAAARWLANRENESDLIGGVSLDGKDRHLAQTLLDLSQTATINDSLKLGRDVLNELGGINTLHKPHVEQAGFAVLKAPDIPSILVETAFISNPDEEKRLNDPAYQDRTARAVLAGIKRYFAKNPPLAPRSTLAESEDDARVRPGARARPN